MIRKLAVLLSVCVGMGVAGCTQVPTVDRSDIDALAFELETLGPGVDPEEAKRAATIAFDYSRQLAAEYEVTDHPLVHNAKVNNGLRERGLCFHWAEDIEARLNQENFRTLALHRAISDPENPFRIDHSTAIISAKGEAFDEGVVLDPWRYGGVLFWAPTLEDTRYNWRPRLEVLHAKAVRKIEAQERTALALAED